MRLSGRVGSMLSRFRVGLSPVSVGGSVRVGLETSSPLVGLVDGRLSGRGASVPLSELRSTTSPDSPGVRAGRVTAPVGRASVSLTADVPAVGVAGRASLPFSILERRSSSSSGTPGVRVPAPVELEVSDGIRVGLPAPVSPLTAESVVVGLAGRPVRKGSDAITRRASASSALAGRKSSLPIRLALADVTARN